MFRSPFGTASPIFSLPYFLGGVLFKMGGRVYYTNGTLPVIVYSYLGVLSFRHLFLGLTGSCYYYVILRIVNNVFIIY